MRHESLCSEPVVGEQKESQANNEPSRAPLGLSGRRVITSQVAACGRCTIAWPGLQKVALDENLSIECDGVAQTQNCWADPDPCWREGQSHLYLVTFISSPLFVTIHRHDQSSRPEAMTEVPVLIVGGGPVGLSASILLSRLGVASLLVEKHGGTALHPKARNINMRTMEIFRQCGVEDAVRAAGLPIERTKFLIWAESLAGREIERRVERRSHPGGALPSPASHCLCAQDDLEPVLRRHAEALAPGTLAFVTELIHFEQDANGVTATVRTAGSDT